MPFLGFRSWPVPFLRPMAPFLVAGATTFYLVTKVQALALQSPEFKNSPKNPYLQAQSATHT